jgi:hypothetical protein
MDIRTPLFTTLSIKRIMEIGGRYISAPSKTPKKPLKKIGAQRVISLIIDYLGS